MTTYLNGRLPASVLAPIPGGRLRKDAAAAWNAMNAESVRRWGIHLRPLGGMSAYRTLGEQDYLWDHSAHPHDTNWVARPGTSNHGWGLAVDLATRAMRWVIDQIGHKYGFSKACSDAPGEWWHIKYNPACTGATWKPKRPLPVVRYRRGHLMRGRQVKRLNKILRGLGFKTVRRGAAYYGWFSMRAVKRIQKKHGLKPDGIVGPKTWRLLLRLAHRK